MSKEYFLDATTHLDDILEIFEHVYKSPRHGNKDYLLDELIYIKLSQQTNAPKFRRMYEALAQKYPGWEGLKNASHDELEEILRPGGLHKQRARDLKRMVEHIVRDRGVLDLSWLRHVSLPDALAYLSTVPGVGIKTAYCIAMYSLAEDVLPVDVHVQRVSERLWLIRNGLGNKKKHEVLNNLIPAGKRYSYHVNCISHGREICRKIPKCGVCPVRQYCTYYHNCGSETGQINE